MSDLSHHEKIALADISRWRGRPFYWREKSMLTLAAKGLVEPHKDYPRGWQITNAGSTLIETLRR